MSAIFRVPRSLCAGGFFLALAMTLCGQDSSTNSGSGTNSVIVIPQGTEFAIVASMAGDQVLPSISLSPSGGGIAWQDNAIEKNAIGIGSSLLDTGFNAGVVFRANKVTTGNQLKPQMQLLANDRILYVWQSSVSGQPCIYARFARNSAKDAVSYGTNFYNGDILVNTYGKDQQVNPSVAALPDGSAIITWASYGQDGSMWGVYARKLTPARNRPYIPSREPSSPTLVQTTRLPAGPAAILGSYWFW